MAQPAHPRLAARSGLRPFALPARQDPAAGVAESAGFEAHPDAQYVVAGSGELVAANRAGRKQLGRVGGIRSVAQQLASGGGARARSLRERIAEVIRTQRPAGEIELPLTNGLSLALRVIPLGPSLDYALVLAAERSPAYALAAKRRFGFTRSEGLVAERLSCGLSVPQIALQLGISIETVRCHLKQAFAKAGVHRQAELVAVMLGR